MLPVATFGSPAGRPLVALHGFLGRGADWATLADLLPGVRVVALDLPGHGAALDLPDAAFSMEGAAEAALATLDALGLRRAALLGYSMGGRLALYLALHAPDRFSHLVLESASPGLRTAAARAARRRLDAERAEALRDDLPAFLDAWYALPLFAATPPPLRARLARERAANDVEGLARSLRHMGTGAQPDLWHRLPSLAVPTFAITGARDAKFADLARRMGRLAPAMQTVVVPEAGHTVHLDAPAAFARHVAAFLG